MGAEGGGGDVGPLGLHAGADRVRAGPLVGGDQSPGVGRPLDSLQHA